MLHGKKRKNDTMEQNEISDVKKRKCKDDNNEKEIMVKNIFTKTQRESIPEKTKFEIIREQDIKCNLCLTIMGGTYEIDHIIPLEQGGTNNKSNLQALCTQCHIFKTSVLDRGVIARIMQAKKQQNCDDFSRNQILEECQMVYFTRHRNIPFHNFEWIRFIVDTTDLYRNLCVKQCNKILQNVNKSEVSLVCDIIKNILKLKANNMKIDLKSSTINIYNNNIYNDMDDDIYCKVNNFFKEIHINKHKNYEQNIGNITLCYKCKNQKLQYINNNILNYIRDLIK